ncbi:Flp pilus assembly complex ATPase component TadA [Pendulispora rubella]|uniref:Flp pilus assembly complex ATPase component TadA n=1 Tax=Pendulispora rubella TaxID=2741070 RepID=A0ABZ2L8D9_9BACT
MQVPIRVTHRDTDISTMLVAAPAVLVVGRHSECQLRLDGDLVSRTHAKLLLGAATFIVEDVSSNGTEVAPGVMLHRARRELVYGSLVRIGPFAVRVGDEDPSLDLAPPPQPSPEGGGGPGVPSPARAPSPPGRGSEHDDEDLVDVVALRRRIHQELLKNLDLAKIDPTRADDPSLRPRVLTALKRIVRDLDDDIPEDISRDAFIGELVEEALGLGPLEPLLADHTVTEVMVVDPTTIFVERAGKLEPTHTVFTDDERVRAVIERIVAPLGRRIDESQPLVDARLRDGSRVNAIIRPLALRGSCITIRKFPKKRLTTEDLVRLGSITPQMARFLDRCVVAKKNILISGGTGSGKTTLLNILSAAIPKDERIVTIEDAAELQLNQPHVVTLETKIANMEGKGAFTIRDLVRNALRMRPDRIVVGECRGGEALDMLQAMNTGHDGSLTTIHANSPEEALARLETLALMAGLDLPSRAIREQIGRSIHVIVQQSRMADGTRKITHISELDELEPDGHFETRTIFEYERTGVEEDGTVVGDFQATGYLPSFIDEMLVRGLIKKGGPYL